MANDVKIGIGLRDNLTRDLQRVTGRWNTFTTRLKTGFSAVSKSVFSVKTAVAALAGGVVIRSIARMIGGVADLGDQFQKLNLRLGISTELLSTLKHAGEQSGIEWNALSVALQRVVRRFEEVRQTGKGVASDAIDILGGGLREAVESGKSFEDLLPLIAERFSLLQSAAQRTYVSFKLFDTEGVKVGTQLLNQGSKALENYAEEARKLGIVVDQDLANASAKYNDELDRLGKAFMGLKIAVVSELLPVLTPMVEMLTKFVVDNRQAFKDFFKDLGDGIREVLPFLKETVRLLWSIQTLGPIRKYFSSQSPEDAARAAAGGARTGAGASAGGGASPRVDWQSIGSQGAMYAPYTLPDMTVQAAGAQTTQVVQRTQDVLGPVEEFWQRYTESISLANIEVGIMESGLSGVESVIAGVVSGVTTWKEAWKRFAQAFLYDLTRIITRLLIVKAIQTGLSAFGAASAASSAAATASSAAGAASASAAATGRALSNAGALMPSAQHGAILSGPATGYPVMMHGREKVTIEPLRHKSGEEPVVVNIHTEIHATDAQSFDRQWARTFGQHQRDIAESVAAEIRRRPMLGRKMS